MLSVSIRSYLPEFSSNYPASMVSLSGVSDRGDPGLIRRAAIATSSYRSGAVWRELGNNSPRIFERVVRWCDVAAVSGQHHPGWAGRVLRDTARRLLTGFHSTGAVAASLFLSWASLTSLGCVRTQHALATSLCERPAIEGSPLLVPPTRPRHISAGWGRSRVAPG